MQEALNNIATGRTVIAIAHRLSTVRAADKIVVLSKGEIIEEGTQEELAALSGACSRLTKAQDLDKGIKGQSTGADGETGEDDEGEKPRDLKLVLTRASTAGAKMDTGTEDKDVQYGLLHRLFIILKEQPSLCWPMAAAVLCCVIAGGTNAATAVLFAKIMTSFQTKDVGRGNFLALMFFVVALGNLVAYAIAGWLANVLAQVSPPDPLYQDTQH